MTTPLDDTPLHPLWDDTLRRYRYVTDTERRTFTEARRRQGFRSQSHLDAFYAHLDHVQTCDECGAPGPAVWLDGSASWQPTVHECDEGARLYQISIH